MGREALAAMSIGREYAFMSDENEDPLDPNDVTKNHDKLKKLKMLPHIIKKMGICAFLILTSHSFPIHSEIKAWLM